ncbi:outer membrane beta-barrel protein [Rufibacter sp. LB8]|uniref:outer membrane beta-barrel protein n=1 Tax=Rufibacter sp. LB8 TaxID=2777781 RepID=UPI00178C76A8|nr:outer membrane beta-barrel protein [Rufibacter sp. LB8]
MTTITFLKGMKAASLVCLLGALPTVGFAQKSEEAPAAKVETILTVNAPAEKSLNISYREATSSYKPYAVKRKPKASFEGGTNELKIGYGVVTENKKPDGMFGPFTASFDRGLGAEVGPGVIGVGASLSYASVSDDESFADDVEFTSRIIVISPRLTYHLDLLQNEQVDLYAGLAYNYATVSASFDYSGDDEDIEEQVDELNEEMESDSEGEIGFLVGASYYFTEKIGAFAEFQTKNLSQLAIGLSIKF